MTTALQRTSLGELGGYSPLLATSLGELGVQVVIELPEFGPGGGSSKKKHSPSAREMQLRKNIRDDDESLILVIKAFLEVIDR